MCKAKEAVYLQHTHSSFSCNFTWTCLLFLGISGITLINIISFHNNDYGLKDIMIHDFTTLLYNSHNEGITKESDKDLLHYNR